MKYNAICTVHEFHIYYIPQHFLACFLVHLIILGTSRIEGSIITFLTCASLVETMPCSPQSGRCPGELHSIMELLVRAPTPAPQLTFRLGGSTQSLRQRCPKSAPRPIGRRSSPPTLCTRPTDQPPTSSTAR